LICSTHFLRLIGSVLSQPRAGRQHVANFAEGEAEPFALLDEREAGAIYVAKNPGITVALRRQQTFALIKPQCPQRHSGLAGKVANGNAIRIDGKRGQPRSIGVKQ
jgi:hypothetical protein